MTNASPDVPPARVTVTVAKCASSATVKFAALKIYHLRITLVRVTVRERKELRVQGKRRVVHAGDVRQRSQPVQTVFTFAVRDGVGPVLNINAHARDAGFIRFLDAVCVQVHEYLAENDPAISEDAAPDMDAAFRDVADNAKRAIARGPRSVHGIALGSAGTDQHPIRE